MREKRSRLDDDDVLTPKTATGKRPRHAATNIVDTFLDVEALNFVESSDDEVIFAH